MGYFLLLERKKKRRKYLKYWWEKKWVRSVFVDSNTTVPPLVPAPIIDMTREPREILSSLLTSFVFLGFTTNPALSWKTYSSSKSLAKNQFIWNVLESWVSPFYKFYDLNPLQDLDRAQLLFIYNNLHLPAYLVSSRIEMTISQYFSFGCQVTIIQ